MGSGFSCGACVDDCVDVFSCCKTEKDEGPLLSKPGLKEANGQAELPMRPGRESVDQILHYPDDSQQVCVLQHMHDNLKREMDMASVREKPTLNPVAIDRTRSSFAASGPVEYPSLVSHRVLGEDKEPQLAEPNPDTALLQRQLQLYEELISLVEKQKSELANASVSPRTLPPPLRDDQDHSVLFAPARGEQPAPLSPAKKEGDQSVVFAPLRQPTALSPAKGDQAVAFAVVKGDTSAVFSPSSRRRTVASPSFVDMVTTSPVAFGQDSMYDSQVGKSQTGNPLSQQDAYKSQIIESDSNALARILKKHFNNFILECEFNSSGNARAYEIIRSRRCDSLEIDDAYSAGHNLTVLKTKSVADLFLQYAMAVIDAQRWGGSLRYAIKRHGESDHGFITISGLINFLSGDKVRKLDAPYKLDVSFTLIKIVESR